MYCQSIYVLPFYIKTVSILVIMEGRSTSASYLFMPMFLFEPLENKNLQGLAFVTLCFVYISS